MQPVFSQNRVHQAFQAKSPVQEPSLASAFSPCWWGRSRPSVPAPAALCGAAVNFPLSHPCAREGDHRTTMIRDHRSFPAPVGVMPTVGPVVTLDDPCPRARGGDHRTTMIRDRRSFPAPVGVMTVMQPLSLGDQLLPRPRGGDTPLQGAHFFPAGPARRGTSRDIFARFLPGEG